MTIYIGHSSSFDYKSELYAPIRNSELSDLHTIVLPHEVSDAPSNSKDQMKTVDLMIAEVSYPSTGLGIELGWADALGVKVVCIHRGDAVPSSAVSGVCEEVLSYDGVEDLISLLERVVQSR